MKGKRTLKDASDALKPGGSKRRSPKRGRKYFSLR